MGRVLEKPEILEAMANSINWNKFW